MLETSEIEKMSTEEQLQTMELLWKSISKTPDQVSSPEWHKKVLSARLNKIKSGKAKFLTLDQVKSRLSNRHK